MALPQCPHKDTGQTGTGAHEALTYSFCCLLEFWVPNLGSTRARQPLLLTMSGALRWPARWRAHPREKEEALTHLAAALAPVIKTTQLPRGGAPPGLLASSPIWSSRAGWLAGWLAREETASRQMAGKRPPCMPRREAFQVGLDTRACFLQRGVRACKALSEGLRIDY